jgi:hypothetical protein
MKKTEITTKVHQICGAWTVHFQVNNQGFSLYPCESKQRAKWYLKQLRKAFENYKVSRMQFHNPLNDLFKIVEKLYGKQKCKVQFDPSIGFNDKPPFGTTVFPDDGSEPIISISAHITICQALDIFAHELAHVVMGKNAEEHGKEWKECFKNIRKAYCKE